MTPLERAKRCTAGIADDLVRENMNASIAREIEEAVAEETERAAKILLSTVTATVEGVALVRGPCVWTVSCAPLAAAIRAR